MAEQVVSALTPTTIVRLAAVYGPNMKGNYLRLLRALAAGRYMPIGSGLNRRTLVYQHDVAIAAEILARDSRAQGQTFNLTDGTTHELREIVAEMASALGRSAPRVHLPVKPVQLAVGAADAIGRLGVYAPVFGQNLRTYLEDVAVAGEKIQVALGFQPSFDLATGWRHVVNEISKV
jgi:UDP-glucose 4-epimerase